MAGTTHRVPRGTYTPDGLCAMTDAEYASKVDTSPSISSAYARLGRVGNPSGRMCAAAEIFGRGNAPRNISGPPRGDAPAWGEVSADWRTAGLVRPKRHAPR